MKKFFTFLLLFVMLGLTKVLALPGNSPENPFTETFYYRYNVATSDVTNIIITCIATNQGNYIPGTNSVQWSNATDWTVTFTGGNIGHNVSSPLSESSRISVFLSAQTIDRKDYWYLTYTVTCQYQGKTYTGYGRINYQPYYESNYLNFSPSSETTQKTTDTWIKTNLNSLLVNNNYSSNKVSPATKKWSVALKTPTGYTEYKSGDYSINSSGVFTTKHAGTYTITCTQDKIWNSQGMFEAGSAEYEITLTEDPVKWDKATYYTSPGQTLALTLFNNMGPWGTAKSGSSTCAYNAGTINWGGYASSFSIMDANHEDTGMYPYRRDMKFVTKSDLSPGTYTITATRVKLNTSPYTNFTATATIVVQQNNTLAYDNKTISSQEAKTYKPTPRISNSTAPITYTYKNNNTGAVTATLPTTPGVYTVTATQAKTGDAITDYPAKEVTFTVSVTAPIIADTETSRSWKVQGDPIPVEHDYYVRTTYKTPFTFNINSTIGLPSSPTVTAAEVTYKHSQVTSVWASSSPTSGANLTSGSKTSTTSNNYAITFSSNQTYGEVLTLKLYMSNGNTNLIHVSIIPSGSPTAGQTTKSYTAEPITLQLDRTFAEGWNTLCLPFDLTRDQFEEAFGTDAKIYEFTSVKDESNTMMFSTVTGGITACTPYLMHLYHAVEDPGFVDVTPIDPAKSPYSSRMNVSQTVNGHTYTYLGNVLVTTINTNNNPGSRYLTASGNIKKPSSSGMSMKGMRAYFIYPAAHDASAKAAQMSFVDEEDNATGISELIETGKIEINDYPEYNINGQRINVNYKGIMIRNGKKYFRK